MRGIDRIVLIGFSGTGKTSVARLLAEQLGWSAADSDAEIERRWGKMIPAIFRDHGETEFRSSERAILKHLLARGAVGAVSSHDLGLADLEAESGGKIVNVHFEESVEDGKMTFDYQLKPGVVTTANALRLMKVIGIDVELPVE